MPTVLLKCQIRLLHDLKNAGYLLSILAVCFGATHSIVFGQKRAIVTPTDDIVRPKRTSCIGLMILQWLST